MTTERNILTIVSCEIIVDPLSKEGRSTTLQSSERWDRSQRFIPHPTVLPEANISVVAHEPAEALRDDVFAF